MARSVHTAIRSWCGVAAAILGGSHLARANDVNAIIRIHVAAIGGRDRIEALHAYRAVGRVIVNGQSVGLTAIAARPNQLRVELQYGDHASIQATDGTHPPWVLESTAPSARPAPMPPAAAHAFQIEAEFDDPLVAPERYGYEIDDAGEVNADGHRLLRLLLTQRLTKTCFLLIDPETYFIAERIEERPSAGGEMKRMVTRYADYRPVAGVLWPHRIAVLVDGQPAREAIFDWIEPNPKPLSNRFTPPAGTSVALPIP